MERLCLNETPRRTSKSFGINNIQIDNFNVPEIKEFTNVKIQSEIQVQNKKVDLDLKYSIGEKLVNELDMANQIIYLDINKKIEKPIVIEFELDKEQNVLIDQVIINAKEDTKANIIIKYKSKNEDEEGYHNGICKVIAEKNSNIKVTILNLLNGKTQNYYSMDNTLEASSNLEYIIADLGGEKTITNYYSMLNGENSNNFINTIYIGKDEQLLDLNYIAETYGKKTNIDIEVYGALKDNSKKHFKGTIDFKKGCKKSKGSENEYCILLSKTAKSKALPMLLCSEDDVQGNHSNSAGKIDDGKLYYIMSRGISSREAKKLIVKAKFNSILEKIEYEDVKQEVVNEIDRRLK